MLSKIRILVVDDFEDFRRFVCSVLQSRCAFQVTEASDGLEAVHKAQELLPDLLLLDIGLPKLNGLDVAHRVLELVPTAKILFFSVESSVEVVRKALSFGALGYIHKSRVHSDLLPAIDAVLAGKRFISSGLEISEGGDTQDPRGHEILFCSNDTVLLESLARFIAGALSVGNAAIVWATESHRSSLLQRLQGQGVDTDAAIERGTYIASDIAEPADPVQMREALRGLREAVCKAAKKHPRIAVCGERAGQLWAEGRTDEALQIEQLMNQLAQSHDIDILCVYPLPHPREKEPALQSICREHTVVYSR